MRVGLVCANTVRHLEYSMHEDEQVRVKDALITLRVSANLKSDAFWAAAADQRTLSSYIVSLIAKDLASKERDAA